MTVAKQNEVARAVQTYFTPILISVIGVLLMRQIDSVDKRIERLENNSQMIYEMRIKVEQLEDWKRLVESQKSTTYYKHEDFYYLTDKIKKA